MYIFLFIYFFVDCNIIIIIFIVSVLFVQIIKKDEQNIFNLFCYYGNNIIDRFIHKLGELLLIIIIIDGKNSN
jgi:hypothetical protein